MIPKCDKCNEESVYMLSTYFKQHMFCNVVSLYTCNLHKDYLRNDFLPTVKIADYIHWFI